ncbi:amine oxidase [flavin-containing]-like [Saccoglossus kowalevskii]|uniref:Amine oxidase n=1 Tax=Saccoglossus kowalevskii TaxID=10224 RepID=A0A0U2STC5_SACKO|nr:PREDICTED: amine oxidase [flavin-containing]-like [Saccoglossus kowalevskii]ALR88561.1 amine oxidase [flavin-containing]-like 111 [Saccoglossus kowalevskii]
MANNKHDVIVIGAGLSGLSAAWLLHKENVDVVVLEARDRVGGRTYTIHNSDVGYCDLGGSYAGPTQNRLFRIAKEVDVDNYILPDKDQSVWLENGKAIPFKVTGYFPFFWNPFIYTDFNYLMREWDRMGEMIPKDAPWDCKYAKEWDNKTMQQWIDENIWTKTVRELARQQVNINVCAEPEEVSMLWFLWYVVQCGGFLRISSNTNGGQERKFHGGTQQISIKISERIGSERVKLNSAVARIQQNEIGVMVTTLDGDTYKADHVIISIPPPLTAHITYDPPLPPLRLQHAQRIPMGSAMKCIAYYKTPFWTKKNLTGSIIAVDQKCPFVHVINDTKPDGSFPAVVTFVVGNKAREFIVKTTEERKRLVCEYLAIAYDNEEALHPVHYLEKSWMTEPYSGGCYTAIIPPGQLTKYGKIIREPVGRLYFAGTETATEWSGYMDGAIQAGERASRQVLHTIGKLSADEIWQNEPQSLDVPAYPFKNTFIERNLPSVGGFVSFFVSSLLVGGAVAGYVIYKNKLIDVSINWK